MIMKQIKSEKGSKSQLIGGKPVGKRNQFTSVAEDLNSGVPSGAPNGNVRENICSEDDLRSRIFGAIVVKFFACLPLLGFSNIYKMA